MIERMDHFTIVTDQLQATREFYIDLLGLTEGPRPPFPVAGLWLYANGHPLLHVVQVQRMPEPRRGVLDHMAFSATDLGATVEKLEARGIEYTLRRQAEAFGTGGIEQLGVDIRQIVVHGGVPSKK